MNKFSFFAFVFLSSFFISCSGDGDDDTNTPDNPVTSKKKIASIVVTSGTFYEVENKLYNYTNNKLTTVNSRVVTQDRLQSPRITTFDYQGNKVFIDMIWVDDPSEKENNIAVLNNSGLISSISTTWHERYSSSSTSNTTLKYSSDGFLTEIASVSDKGSTSVIKFSYSNENLISEEQIYTEPNYSERTKITYTYGSVLNKGNIIPPTFVLDQSICWTTNEMFYAGLLGKASKNLVSSAKYESFNQDGSTRYSLTETVTYTLNEGYVTKCKVMDDGNDWYELTYTYND